MKLSNKKGFTIVELVVVVAVIAILAAVLIPTVSGIIAKARLNADQQAVSNMNKAVAIYAAEEEIESAGDAVQALYAYGFNNGKLETYSRDYHYAYSLEDNEFYLLDDNNTVAFPKGEEDRAISDLWAFYNNSKANKAEGITKYVALDSLKDAMAFDGQADSVFAGDAAYTIDLNNNVALIDGKSTVKLINGSVVGDGFNLGTTAQKLAVASTNELTTPNAEGKIVVKDKVITSKSFSNATATAYEFKNCTFTFNGTVTFGSTTATVKADYVFEDCNILNSANSWIQIIGNAAEKPNVTIKNCYVASCRGFNFLPNGKADRATYGDIVIEGNTFVNTDVSKGKTPIQFASSLDNANTMTANSITIKDNNFVSGVAAIMINDTCHSIDCGTIAISGNKLADKMVNVIGDNNDESKACAATFAVNFN